MTSLQKYWGTGLALGGGVIVLLLVLGHSAAVAQSNVAPPNVPDPSKVPDNTVNFPDYPPIDLGNITFNTTPPAPAPGCACGCQNASGQFVAQFQDLVNQYDAGIHDLLSNFSDALLASVPKYNGGTFNIDQPASTLANLGV